VRAEEYENALDGVKWPLDWLVKANPDAQTFYCQVWRRRRRRRRRREGEEEEEEEEELLVLVMVLVVIACSYVIKDSSIKSSSSSYYYYDYHHYYYYYHYYCRCYRWVMRMPITTIGVLRNWNRLAAHPISVMGRSQ